MDSQMKSRYGMAHHENWLSFNWQASRFEPSLKHHQYTFKIQSKRNQAFKLSVRNKLSMQETDQRRLKGTE